MIDSRWNRCNSVGCGRGKVLPKAAPSRVLDLSVSQDADSLFQSGLTGTTKSAGWLSQTRFLPRRCRRRQASRDGCEEVVGEERKFVAVVEVCLRATGASSNENGRALITEKLRGRSAPERMRQQVSQISHDQAAAAMLRLRQ
jgi:hypothetical protein